MATVNLFIKTMAIVLSGTYSFLRINGQKNKMKYIQAGLLSIFWSITLIFLRLFLPLYFIIIILLAASCGAFCFMLKIKPEFVFTAILLSFAIALVIFTVSGILSSFIYALLFDTRLDDYKIYLMLLIFQLIFTFSLFSIRRFQSGFPFLQSRTAFIISLLLSGLTLIMNSLIANVQDDFFLYYIVAGIIITGIGVVIWIRRGITMFYKKKLKENAIQLLEDELRRKQEELEAVQAENKRISSANHKINQRLTALENNARALAAAISIEDGQAAEKCGEFFEQITALAGEYKAETMNAPRINIYDKTNISEIDALLEMFSRECGNKDIAFTVKVKGSINFMTEKVIDRSGLETMIGDHLRDAVVAVEKSENKFRAITMLLGLFDSCFELTVNDSGIEFEPHILAGLGAERVTTHKDSGGSGIGFMTTFEALRQCAGSLIITEHEPSENNFTKSITIRFDGKSSFIIRTYRAAELYAETAARGRGNEIMIEKA